MNRDGDKRLAAGAAAKEIMPGMIVGLGTGSTAAWLVTHLGARIADGLEITAVTTSIATEQAARAAGIRTIGLDDLSVIDLAIDGVDEIDGRLRAIKGAGGAMLREKIVASAARRMIAIADGTKRVDRLGVAPVPIEVLPLARAFVRAHVESLGATVALRRREDHPARTDQNNMVLDCVFGTGLDPDRLAAQLSAIPGVLGHGLFLQEIDCAYIATDGIIARLDRAS